MLATGLDHRCVHSLLAWKVSKYNRYWRKGSPRKPFRDEDTITTLYHMGLQCIDANNKHQPQLLPKLEKNSCWVGVVAANGHDANINPTMHCEICALNVNGPKLFHEHDRLPIAKDCNHFLD